jgi:hypothetical protein
MNWRINVLLIADSFRCNVQPRIRNQLPSLTSHCLDHVRKPWATNENFSYLNDGIGSWSAEATCIVDVSLRKIRWPQRAGFCKKPHKTYARRSSSALPPRDSPRRLVAATQLIETAPLGPAFTFLPDPLAGLAAPLSWNIALLAAPPVGAAAAVPSDSSFAFSLKASATSLTSSNVLMSLRFFGSASFDSDYCLMKNI